MTIISERGEKVSSMFDKYNFPPSSGEVNFVVEDVESSLDKLKIFLLVILMNLMVFHILMKTFGLMLEAQTPNLN